MAQLPVAIVTGGAQGIGAAIVQALLKNGYKVTVADLQKEKGEEFVKQLQNTHGLEKVAFVECDVTKENEYRGVFEFTLKEFKRIDVVVNNAGIVDEHNPRRALEVNLMGPITGCQLALEYLGKSRGGKGGIVVSTSSLAGLIPLPRTPVYSATKHGIVGLTRSLGSPYHLERDGLIFTALCPSHVATPIFEKCQEKSPYLVGHDPRMLRNLMSPDFVAEAFLKLLQDRINGSILTVSAEKGYEYVGYQDNVKDFAMLVL